MENADISRYSGYIMRKDEVVAEIIDGRVENVKKNAPLYIKKTKNFIKWISNRGADISRSCFRNILRVLDMPLTDIVPAVMFVNAACINDTYWVKRTDEEICFKDTIFNSDNYFKAALSGDPDIYDIQKGKTPEVTNIGSYNKGWKKKDDEWYLYKSGSPGNIYAEIFASKLGKEAGLDIIEYWTEGKYTVCKNFINTKENYCFEAANGIMDNIRYMDNCEIAKEMGLEDGYKDIIFFDAIIRNGDRHGFNYGFISDGDGKLRIAPIFDNNESLFYAGEPETAKRNDILVNEFKDICVEYGYKLPVISESIVRKAANESVEECGVKVNTEKIIDFCMNAYKDIKKACI